MLFITFSRGVKGIQIKVLMWKIHLGSRLAMWRKSYASHFKKGSDSGGLG